MADYLTRPELEAVKKKRGLQSIVRDFNYGLDWDKEEIESENIHDPKNEEIRPAKKNSIIEGLHLSVCIKVQWLKPPVILPLVAFELT